MRTKPKTPTPTWDQVRKAIKVYQDSEEDADHDRNLEHLIKLLKPWTKAGFPGVPTAALTRAGKK